MFVKSTLTAAIIALSLGAAPVLASGAVSEATQTQVTEMLTADGYEVRKIEMEDGMIEVYALKDGAMMEIYFDADLNIVRIVQK